jgi:uncharacterized protein DUF6448
MKNTRIEFATTVTIIFALALLLPSLAWAHCDALDGPLVTEARAALEANDVKPLLKWVRAQDEAEIREAFARTVAVRKLGAEAKEVADTYFFETLVRIHRAGEGAPYSGLKPAGLIDPAFVKADRVLEGASINELADSIAAHAAAGLRERYARAAEARKHANDSVEAGREFVEAYVTYIHYVEGISNLIHGGGHH